MWIDVKFTIMALEILQKIQSIDNAVKSNFNGSYTILPPKLDRLLKWVPMVSVLLTDAERAGTKNELTKRVKIIALSEAILNGLISPIKKWTARRRPDSFRLDSFPSTQTAVSFMGAEILHQACKERLPALQMAGYSIAAATAVISVYKKKHWLSDVVAGAVLGIAAAKIATWLINRKDG